MVQGKLGNYRTGGEANDNITTKKKNVHVKRGTKSVLFYCVFIAFQSRYIFLNKPTRALLFLVSVSFCPLPSTAPKKARFMSILVIDLVFGFEASRRKRRANISLKPAKYLRRYSPCKHRIEIYLCLIYRLKAEFMNHSIRVVHSPYFMYFQLLLFCPEAQGLLPQ